MYHTVEHYKETMDLIQESQWLFSTLLTCISIITLHISMEYLEKYKVTHYNTIKNVVYDIAGVLFIILLLTPIDAIIKQHYSTTGYTLGFILGGIIAIAFIIPQRNSNKNKEKE